MAKNTLKRGHYSFKNKRLFVPTVQRPTLLIKVGVFARTVGERCVRKVNSTHVLCMVKGKGMYSKGVEINNSAITNKWRYKYARGE